MKVALTLFAPTSFNITHLLVSFSHLLLFCLQSLLCRQLWVCWRGLGSTMGQNNSSNPLRENLESLHNQMMKHAGADYDIATTTTLTYDQFLAYITQLNQM